jgi:hypothetical protein
MGIYGGCVVKSMTYGIGNVCIHVLIVIQKSSGADMQFPRLNLHALYDDLITSTCYYRRV